MSVTYDVDVVYRTHGSLGNESFEKPNRGMGELLGKVGDLETKLGSTLSNAADAMLGLTVKVGATLAGAAGLVLGFAVRFNAEMESTTLALGGIFQSQNVASSLTEGLEMGASILRKMRKDAADLPGEFAELVPIFQTIAISSLHAGMSVNETEGLAAKTMAFAKVSGIKSDMAGREMAALLEGHAGQHNILGQRLGIGPADVHRFNTLGADKRASEITQRLSGYQDAFDAEGKTFAGLSSTLIDHVKDFARTLSGPLFERVKVAIGEANSWFVEHQSTINAWAMEVGYKLGSAFDYAKEKLVSWGPAIFDVLKRVEAFFERTPFEKIEKILALYATVKVGSAAMGGVGSMLGAGASASALLGGGGAAGGIAGAVEAMGGAGVVAGAAAITSAALAVAAVGVEGAVHQVNQPGMNGEEHSRQWHLWAESVNHVESSFLALKRIGDDLEPTYRLLADTLGSWYLQNLEAMTFAMAKTIEGMSAFTGAINDVGYSMAKWVADHGGPNLTTTKDSMVAHNRERVGHNKRMQEDDPLDRHGDVTANPPSHHTTIHKVEILVSSNQDASRVARLTKEALADLTRNPKSSRRGHAFTPHQ